MKKLILAGLIFLSPFTHAGAAVRCSDVAVETTDGDTIARDIFDPAENEKLTIEVMRQVAERTAKHQDTVVGWLDSIKESQSTLPLDPLEHAALMFILKNGAFDKNPAATKSLEETLALSYRHLTGREPVRDDIRSPLPASVFKTGDERARLFHAAIFDFESADEMRSLKGRIKRLKAKITTSNLFMTLSSLAVLSFEPGRETFAGALIGLTEAAFNEYLIHIGVGHAPKDLSKKFRRWGAVGKFLEQITMTHKLHHMIVAQDFGAAILTPEQKAVADKALQKLSENLVLDRMREKNPELSDENIRETQVFKDDVQHLVDVTRKGGYGTNGTLLGAAGMLASATPFYLMNYAIFAATGSHEFLISSQVALTGMIVQSLYSHWHFHFRAGDHPEMKVNRLQTWYMNSAIGKFSQRLHFTHHELPYAFERTKNGDIMAGSIADRLKGDLQKTSVLDLIRMYQQRFLGEMRELLPPDSAAP